MPTFDQLSAEERAIVELVVQRGRSYDALADVLQMEPTRVREMARDALIQLSPLTAERVDAQWRSQVADYLLGQQSGPESTATRGHLKRSEPARTWALSLLDSLSDLYPDGSMPSMPDAEGAGSDRRRLRGGNGAAAAERPRERERERKPLRSVEEREERKERKPAREETAAAEEPKPRRELSPDAKAALKRRRLIGAGVLGVVVVVAVLAIAGVFGGSSKKKTKTAGKPAAAAAAKIVGQIPLRPINGASATGNAFILQRGNQRVLVVQAKLPPLPSHQRKAAYEVWLYNSPKDAQSIGAQFTDAQGNYQGAGPLPANFARFKSVDISREPFDTNTAHSGNSLLRGDFANLQQVQQPAAGASTTPGVTTPGTTTPAPGGTGTTGP